ncbi:MAG: TIGR03087 family PEP-CTERM/XrtA system glycosyltransferase [Gammaproteobacteria bacterium]|nr:TIGR03087 family PEP-CTERM/XrtA system glycosyltransferase [Gammaproteobacteria bacterium]
MEKLLYLVHRIPFPPNKGDKIRSFHWLKGLARQYEIYLGCFVDEPEDMQYIEQLKPYCADVYIEQMNTRLAKLKSAKGLLSNSPLTLSYYYSKKMQHWVEQVVHVNAVEKCLIFSSSMAQYVEGDHLLDMTRVIDFVDMDSDKWLQYATNKSWPMSYVYAREGRLLGKYEQKVSKEFDCSLFVSSAEAESFSGKLNDTSVDIGFVNNGVDADYFSPQHELKSPYAEGVRPIVFTGAMDYWANVDAVVWFVKEVLPSIKASDQKFEFFIVGSKPTVEVQSLDSPGIVTVTGRVADVRPYIAYAEFSVAPMRIARGIQNKVLEAMAMAKPVITSSLGFEGIKARVDEELFVADTVEQFLAVLEVLGRDRNTGSSIGQAARRRVMADYSWSSNIQKLDSILSGHKAQQEMKI